MFTGIVEERAEIASVDGARLVVRCGLGARASVGDSIAVNGVCLTVVEQGNATLSFDVSSETFARTALGARSTGDPVNLERPATLSSRLGGHLVQGHVDGVAPVTAVRPEGAGGARLSVRLSRDLLPYVVEKGSIALDGVSLTVAAIAGDLVEIALIPHTLRATTFGSVRPGDSLNVEVDVIAKYVARAVAETAGPGAESTGRRTRPGGRREERSA
jgi:riboflavin synthase